MTAGLLVASFVSWRNWERWDVLDDRAGVVAGDVPGTTPGSAPPVTGSPPVGSDPVPDTTIVVVDGVPVPIPNPAATTSTTRRPRSAGGPAGRDTTDPTTTAADGPDPTDPPRIPAAGSPSPPTGGRPSTPASPPAPPPPASVTTVPGTTSTVVPTTTTTTTAPAPPSVSISIDPENIVDRVIPLERRPVLRWAVDPSSGLSVTVTGIDAAPLPPPGEPITGEPFTVNDPSGSRAVCPGTELGPPWQRTCTLATGTFAYAITVEDGTGTVVASQTATLVVTATTSTTDVT